MTIIESIKEWLLRCPYLADLSGYVDFLPSDPNTYSLEEVPTQVIVREYLDGSSERQFLFVFATRMYYSDELRNNLENSGFWEHFSDWIEYQNDIGNLPVLKEGLTPSKVEAMSSGYLFDIGSDMSHARYQIQCRLLYDKE